MLCCAVCLSRFITGKIDTILNPPTFPPPKAISPPFIPKCGKGNSHILRDVRDAANETSFSDVNVVAFEVRTRRFRPYVRKGGVGWGRVGLVGGAGQLPFGRVRVKVGVGVGELGSWGVVKWWSGGVGSWDLDWSGIGG